MISEKELNSYRLTSMEEPTDEMLAQIMHEAAEIYREEHEDTKKKVETKATPVASTATEATPVKEAQPAAKATPAKTATPAQDKQ